MALARASERSRILGPNAPVCAGSGPEEREAICLLPEPIHRSVTVASFHSPFCRRFILIASQQQERRRPSRQLWIRFQLSAMDYLSNREQGKGMAVPSFLEMYAKEEMHALLHSLLKDLFQVRAYDQDSSRAACQCAFCSWQSPPFLMA